MSVVLINSSATSLPPDRFGKRSTITGAFTVSAERMIELYTKGTPVNRMIVDTDIFDYVGSERVPVYENSDLFAEEFAPMKWNHSNTYYLVI